jgi:methylmalonyl-CoA/ethylmalonyl-CoA epimerase
MISRIDHIAIAVKDHEKALHFFRDVLGAIPGESYEVPRQNFIWQSLVLGDLTRLELVTPMGGDGGLLGSFLSKREGGFHHITLQTPDLGAAIRRLEEHGIPCFGRHEYPDGTWKEVFIHPRDAFGVLVQIAEFSPSYWMIPEAQMPESRRWEIAKTGQGFTLTLAHPGGGKVAFDLTIDELKDLSATLQKALE